VQCLPQNKGCGPGVGASSGHLTQHCPFSSARTCILPHIVFILVPHNFVGAAQLGDVCSDDLLGRKSATARQRSALRAASRMRAMDSCVDEGCLYRVLGVHLTVG
jgi:hypothetical protein